MAVSTMTLSATMQEKYKTEVNASHRFIIDQPKSAGGEDAGANPLEHFLASLAGCMTAIGRIAAQQQRINLRGMKVTVEGDIDKNVLLGKNKKDRAGFTEIRTYVEVDADLTDSEKEEFIETVENRCPVADVMKNGTKVKAQLS